MEDGQLTEKYLNMLNVRKDEKNVLERVEEEFQKLSQSMDPKANPDCGGICAFMRED